MIKKINYMSELDKRIENRELAHTMALAEVPHRAIAQTALEYGETEARDAALKTAKKLGLQAGKDYLQEMLVELELQEQEFLHEVNIVRATEDEMYGFNPEYRYTSNTRTRAWNVLERGHKVYERHGLQDVLVTETPASDDWHRPKVIALNLDERLMNILPEIQECGKLSQAFIKEFYAAKLAEKVVESAE
jgi:hypothetical protein